MIKITLTIILLMLSTSIFGKNSFKELRDSDLPRKAKSIVYDDSGKIIELVKNSWSDRLKSKDGGHVYYSYEQGYNYEKKQGFLKVYDDKKNLIEEKWDKEIDGAICQEEALIAFDVFKNNAKVKKQFALTDEVIELQTGFNFQDDDKCKLGNRCVHVFASAGDVTVLAHSIVKLSDLSVPYPEYDMETTHEKLKLGLYKSTNKNQ